MKFPEIGKLGKGRYYVMEIEGGCILHVPVSDDQRERDDLIDQIEEYSFEQYVIAENRKSHTMELDIEVELDPEPPELA